MLNKAKTLYYRGFIKSCNYTCSYCPFAKKQPSAKEIARDQQALEKFYQTVAQATIEEGVNIFFTPYGEALIYPHVQSSLAQFSKLPQVAYVGIQTNLSCEIKKLVAIWQKETANLDKIKLWCSFHPDMVDVDSFAQNILDIMKFVEVSVGAVGNPANLESIQQLRKKLPPSIYLWINKMDGLRRHYTLDEITDFKAIDPFFDLELKEPSTTQDCLGGHESFFIEAAGEVYACNRSKASMGNLYKGSITYTPCQRKRCDCYLAYSNLTNLPALQHFGRKRTFRLLEKHKFQVIFIDVDGTLTNKRGVITPEVEATIAYLAQRAKIYLVTALPYHLALQKCRKLKPFISGGIFENGMYVCDFETGQKQQHTFSAECMETLKGIGLLENKIMNSSLKAKILVRLGHKEIAQFIEVVKELDVQIEKEKHCIYVMPKGCNKVEQTIKFCKEKGWQEEQVLVVGNSENDGELLGRFPYSVAMPWSEEQVKKQARYCLSVEQIGLIIEEEK